MIDDNLIFCVKCHGSKFFLEKYVNDFNQKKVKLICCQCAKKDIMGGGEE